MKSFKIGEPVLFCDGWGLTMNPEKTFRWGEVHAGFITDIEEIESRNSKLYTVGTVDTYDKTKVHTKLLGEHLIFKIDEMVLALAALNKYCEEC